MHDQADIEMVLSPLFTGAGYEFSSVSDGRSGLHKLHEFQPDLVVLDIGLPGEDGLAMLGRIRDTTDLPVLLLSARDRTADKVRGLRAGADDYLSKPFSGPELLARVHGLLRRSGRAEPIQDEIYDDGLVRIDHRTRLVTVDGGELELTAIEFRLLNMLVQHEGAVLSLAQLLAAVWDDPCAVAPDRVKFAVLRLRAKLGWKGQFSPITAIRGIGYRYRSGSSSSSRVYRPRRSS
ncbi:response regulator transcription factor [Amycolatopsis sp. NPDC051128]|uniref:response regulator transcription factor n=1 Tax=Amycolatopsis sp. NPDC051128 TaxID=3155412 RepID=UPI003430DD15